MNKIIASIALLVSLNAACSEQQKIGYTLFSLGDTEQQSPLCTAKYVPNPNTTKDITTINIISKRPCADVLRAFKEYQQLEKLSQPATLEVCHKGLFAPSCSTTTHASMQAAINALQGSPIHQLSIAK